MIGCSTVTFSQDFRIKGGTTFGDFIAKDNDGTYSDEYKNRAGIYLGASVESKLNNVFSVETGLFFTSYNTKVSVDAGAIKYEDKINLNYLQVPGTFIASIKQGNVRVYAQTGAYLGLGISGKVKSRVESGSSVQEEEEDIEWGNDEEEDDLRRLDMGLIFGGGIEFKKIQLGANYALGLLNISTVTDNGAKFANRAFNITLGYKFLK